MLNWFKRRRKDDSSYETNEEWIRGLSAPADEKAVEQLRDKLIRGLKPALHKYVDRELDQFVEDVAQDALLKILDNIDTFRGESKLTTWAMKIAVREGLTELRRKKYDDSSIEDFKYPNDEGRDELTSLTFATELPDPEEATHEQMILRKVLRIINEELTEKQRRAMKALMMQGLSATVVAEQMGTNRNALYKLVHDARLKIKNQLELEGVDPAKLFNN
ncbi:RNA polymerase sigma factor [Fodinibius halophilus]|uniref:Sigma-70 family RNA polymerase sigma factor n=1 Tax=Fodinibius halophilus TaxID=1736908 RepID=A0A6M1T3T2_9BACT|nr:sigma-70 family RNA polymerase sigma factor [Fodinibius halophilus]NGP88749.1 sigma-70 family RNA polymerase sigma factor [Fodinibius halophilus]